MEISLNAEELAFQDEVREFIDENFTKIEGKPLEIYFHWVKALYKKGWSVPKWPIEHGGTGWSAVQHWIWDRETTLANTPPTFSFGVSMIGPILYTYGTKEQQERFLPGIRDYSVRWCQGYSEPGAGSDLAALKTKAELSGDGSHYIVNGQKIWTTQAHFAHWMFCLTRTSDTGKKQEGITFLLIDMSDPGVDVQPIYSLGGQHELNTVYLTNVKVPVENRIGEQDKGWTYAKGLLQHERTGLAGIGRTSVALEREKQSFAEVSDGYDNLMTNPGFRKKVAQLEIELKAAEFLELKTLSTVAEGGAPGPESSILKLKGTEMQQRLSELKMEAAGYYASPWAKEEIGLPWGPNATQRYLFQRATTIYGGASEVQRDVIAKKVLGLK